MRTFVIGDIHGQKKGLEQCIERSGIDPENDRLIVLGDVVDRGPESAGCIEMLRNFHNLIYIIGNHDIWMINWLKEDKKPQIWIKNGGQSTIDSYEGKDDLKANHLAFFEEAVHVCYDKHNNVYTHGGINPELAINNQEMETVTWDRKMWHEAQVLDHLQKKIEYKINEEDSAEADGTIFIGHTNTQEDWPDLKPVKKANVWNLDQGAGHGGKLTIMEVESQEYWQSDKLS